MAVTTEPTGTTADTPPEEARDPASLGSAMRVRIPGSDVSVGPVGYLAEERQRLESLTWDNFDVQRCSATIGAELSGIDITGELADEEVVDIAKALADYKVIFFRDQPLSARQHVDFARRFGELEIHPFIPSNTGVPELVRFAKSADVGGYENGWHHDVTWRETPSKGAVLHALEVPATGGDTVFSDAYAALDALDDDLRGRIDDLVAVHDFAKVFGHGMSAEERATMREKYPLVEHPVITTHDITGRDLLYVNRFFVSHIAGMDPDASTELIDELCKPFALLEHQARFRWEPDSVAFWDNRAVQHYACSDYWPDVRVMERASIIGSRPSRAR
ncbi:MAG: TauD/TfdA family dioxygenase [Microthrixaceae bacterium]|nr:TauD/TfdA family dioxygenase [Microthrixaceae bacterium]